MITDLDPRADPDRSHSLDVDLHTDHTPDAAGELTRIVAARRPPVAPAPHHPAEAVAEPAPRVEPAPRPLWFVLEGAGPGLPPARARRAAVGLGLGAGVALASLFVLGVTAILLAGFLSMTAIAAWITRRRPSELAVYDDGFEDARWAESGRIGWGDVAALDPDFAAGVLDLELTAPAAERLSRTPGQPEGVLVWEGRRPVYRLPVGSGLDRVYQAVEARSGRRVY
ncbi:MAG TPA: hypothetical protein VK002_10040 [Rubricoccaceae bacterium]|jgi:hypothetical protein|nr:hypothetical protein [Rubricoccaceae bacterium]